MLWPMAATKVDSNYIRESILEPKAKIAALQSCDASVQGQLSDDDIDSLIAYIKTMGVSPAPASTPGTCRRSGSGCRRTGG